MFCSSYEIRLAPMVMLLSSTAKVFANKNICKHILIVKQLEYFGFEFWTVQSYVLESKYIDGSPSLSKKKKGFLWVSIECALHMPSYTVSSH